MKNSSNKFLINQMRLRVGLALTLIGFIIAILGAAPFVFGLDRSPAIGFVQLGVFLIGMAALCFGGYLSMAALWNGGVLSIAADFGLRLVATGYVITAVSAMSDVFGLGTQPLPEVPCFGPWQVRGVVIGEVVIGLGFLMLIPWDKCLSRSKPQVKPASVNNSNQDDCFSGAAEADIRSIEDKEHEEKH